MPTFSRTQEISHEIGQAGRFSLRVTSSDVELRAVDGDEARVRIEFEIRAVDDVEADSALDRIKFVVNAGSGYLDVSEPRRGEDGLGALVRLFGGGDRVEARIVCEVPSGAQVSYAGVSADLIARGFVGVQEYRTVSGDAVLSDVRGSVRISSVSGDVSLRASGPVGLLANSVSGDFSAIAPTFDRSRVTTVSGDVELEGDLRPDGEHRFETVSGDLSLGTVGGMTLEVRGLSTDVSVSLPHRSEGSRDRRRYVVGDGSAHVVFSSMSGDVLVSPSRRFDRGVTPPTPPTPATPPMPPTPPAPPMPPVTEEEQLAILRALEAGEIDVDEANRRLSGERDDG